MLTHSNGLEDKFFSRREAERSLELFVHGKEEQYSNALPQDDLSSAQLVRHQHELIRLLLRDIKQGTYRLEPALPVSVFAGKARIVHKFPLLEQFLLAHFARCLSELIEPRLPDSLFSFRRGRGNIGALKRVSAFIKSNPGPLYVLRRDIKNFGETLVHKHVLADFDRFFPDAKCLRALLEQICRFPLRTEGGVVENTLGLPTGSYLQLIFENLYLLKLDHEFSAIPDAEHIRFGDDILFITDSAGSFAIANQTASRLVANRKLIFHPDKSQNILLLASHKLPRARRSKEQLEPRTHFDYLGLRVFADGTISLSPKKQRALQNEIRSVLTSVLNVSRDSATREQQQELLVRAVRELFSKKTRFRKTAVRGYLSLCSDASQLKQIDRWIALQILSLTCKRGFKKSNFRDDAWRRLRKLGLPSLLHLRRVDG